MNNILFNGLYLLICSSLFYIAKVNPTLKGLFFSGLIMIIVGLIMPSVWEKEGDKT